MLNFDDYGVSDEVDDLILSYAEGIENSAISVLVNRVSANGIAKLLNFDGNINLHIDLVEGPFLAQVNPVTTQQICREIELQYKAILEYGIRPVIVDFHQNSHKKIKVIMALIKSDLVAEGILLRPLIQSTHMRKSFSLRFKNFAAKILQYFLGWRGVNFYSCEVLSGLDGFSKERWGELHAQINSKRSLILCHPHYYSNERLFCEYVRCFYSDKR